MEYLRSGQNKALLIITLFFAISSCARQSDEEFILESALEISMRIDFSGQRGGMFGEIAHQYAELGQFEKAIKIAEEIEDSFYKDLAFSYIVESLTKEEKLDEALEIVNKINEGTSRDHAYYNLSIAYAKLGKFESALKFADSIIDGFSRSSSLGGIAQSFFEQKNEEDASKIMERAFFIAEAIKDSLEKDRAMLNIACGYIRINESVNAFEITNCVESDNIKAMAFTMMAELSLQSGDTVQAVNALMQAYEIASKWDDISSADRQRSLARIGANIFAAGEENKGLKIIRSLDNETIKAGTLVRLGYRYKKEKKKVKAAKLFGEALYTIGGIENEKERHLSRAKTAWEFAMIEEKETADMLLSKSLDISKRIDERDDQRNILYWISWGYIELGAYEKCLEVCKELNDSPNDQIKLLIKLVEKQTKSGRKLGWKARMMINDIVASGEKKRK